MWLKGREPWASRDSEGAARYFQAGGNGVAMRILPHALKHAKDDDFQGAARNIVLNGIATHGHPSRMMKKKLG
jgi:ADP-ribosylglycohydrolase